MTDPHLSREDRTMRDPKKQAQAQAQERYGKNRSRQFILDDWSEICEGMEVITARRKRRYLQDT